MQIPHHTLRLLGFNATGDLGPLTAYTSSRAGTVWFPKSPPLKPPSIHQLRQMDRFRFAARAWKAENEETRDRWHLAAHRARLVVHGYTLYVWWQLSRDRPAMRTIELQSGLSLV